jgi:alpha-mannosidase
MEKYIGHVISNTHWDREWRYNFEETRMMLVRFFERLFNILETEPGYRCFHMDGQTCPVEDYLEIMPGSRKKLERFIREGRILIGPWYTLPEEFSVGGEAIVRNLLLGEKVGKKFGGCMKVGYTPTSYGQISQMAQIYKEFGIDTIIFYRGITQDECDTEYILESPDGTRILGIRMSPSFCRANFWAYLSRPTIFKKWPFEGKYKWTDGDKPFRITWRDTDYMLLNSDYDKTFNPSHIKDGLKLGVEDLLKGATTRHLLFLDGMDSTFPHPNTVKIIKEIKKIGGAIQLVHSSLPEFVNILREDVKWEKLRILRGERRMPNRVGLFDKLNKDAISSEVFLKTLHFRAESELERWAELWASFAWLMGKEYPKPWFDIAWRELLRSEAHDSIGGTSIDRVTRDVIHRFERVLEITDSILRESLSYISKSIDTGRYKDEDIFLVIFNPSPFQRAEILPTDVDFPIEKKNMAFQVEELNGKVIPHQVLSKEATYGIIKHSYDAPFPFYCIRRRLMISLEDVPTMGYKTIRIKMKDGGSRNVGSLVPSPHIIENKYLKVKIARDGTLAIRDKVNDRDYSLLHYFMDEGEAGDPWARIAPPEDRTITSIGGLADISLEKDGPLFCKFKVVTLLKLPISLDAEKRTRVKEKVDYPITSFVSLRKDSRRVDIETVIENSVRDHRLRVMFPTFISAENSYADSGFDVVKRPITLPDTSSWVEPMTGTNPMHSFVDVTDGKYGLAIITKGIPEYEVIDDEARTIAITLLRCYRYPKVGGGDQQVDMRSEVLSQCPGTHRYFYSIYPHKGGWKGVPREVERFNYPGRVVQMGGGKGSLPSTFSFLKIEPKSLILSAVKKCEDRNSLIVRFYNPTEKDTKGKIFIAREIERARLLYLNEQPKKDLRIVDKNSVPINVNPKKIVTLELSFK